jgi:sugar lactone lactonase YvrE
MMLQAAGLGLLVALCLALPVWALGVPMRDASLVDRIWSLLVAAPVLAYADATAPLGTRGALMLALLVLWAARLALHIGVRNWGHFRAHRSTRMKAAPLDVLCAARNEVGESPLWSVSEQALYWVDIEGRRIHRFDWARGHEQSWQTPERVGCIALHADGGLVGAMETGLFRVRLDHGGVANTSLLHGISFPRPGMRFNDGRTDRAGRLWVTSMVRDMSLADPSGALYCCDRRGLSGPHVQGLVTANGLGFSPDGRTMYLSDSHPDVRRVWAFDLDDNGEVRDRREFIDMNRHTGRPDGAAVDAEGCYWICGNDAGVVHRFTPMAGSIAACTYRPPSLRCAPSAGRHWITCSSPPSRLPGPPRATTWGWRGQCS